MIVRAWHSRATLSARLLERIQHSVEVGMLSVLTGQVGSGKSTSLRYAASMLHPSGYRILAVIATSGTSLEMFHEVSAACGMEHRATTRLLDPQHHRCPAPTDT